MASVQVPTGGRGPIRVDLWHVRTDAVDDPATIAAGAELLSAGERTRHARFLLERHRHEYLVTRVLARGVLATYVRRRPGDLAFVLTEHGQPLLEGGGDLRFNLSNTPELVVCAVRRAGAVGVDAEPVGRADTILSIAGTVFTPPEREHLDRLPPPARRRRAVELWTLKEAYMKARGLGMALPPDRFGVEFGDDRRARIVGDDERWDLETLEIEGHLVSTCVERGVGDPGAVDVRVHRADLGRLLRVGR